MRLTRWKLMAGVLGLSMCGLAALAEPACRTVGITRRADEPNPTPPEAAKPAIPPLPVAVPAPPSATEVPAAIPLVEDKKPLPAPVALPPAELKPIALPPVNDTSLPVAVDPKLLADVHKLQNPQIPLPTISEKLEPVAPLPRPVELPSPVQNRAEDLRNSAPLPVIPPKPASTEVPFQVPVSVAPAPKPVDPVPAPTFVVPVADTKPVPVPVSPPVITERPASVPVAAGTMANKKLKVTLHLSDEKPWFEIKDGDEVVLKVTADGVQLVAGASKGSPANTLTAVGTVTFRTLGGFGTCDELTVVPGTGEVVVTGKVSVTSNWGKSETTATADKMTFRLGSEPKK